MNEDEIISRIHRFFFRLLPQAKLAKTFSSETIHKLIKEGMEVSRLGEMEFVQSMKNIDPEISVENALEDALHSLLDNLRFGKGQAEHLKQAVTLYAPKMSVQRYVEMIERRNTTREDYLYACTLIQDSYQKDEVKAYLMLQQLVLVHRINRVVASNS
jgi:hypothetical protein